MDVTVLCAKLESWASPLGPFRTLEEVYREMEEETHNLGSSAAFELVRVLVQLEAKGNPLLQDLGDFLEVYSRYYPDALGEALLQYVCPAGPPILVELLGCTGNSTAVTQLRKVLAFNQASDELLEALVGTLKDLGGAEALEILHHLQKKENLSKQVQEEINTALSHWDSFK